MNLSRNQLHLQLAAAFLGTCMVLPLVPLVVWSFASSWYFPDVAPGNWSLKPWTYALSDRSGALASLWTTAIIAISVTSISVVLGVPAGRALGTMQFRSKQAVELALLAPLLVPPLATTLGIHGVFIWLGLTNSLPGVILVHLVPALPYMIFVMSGVFANYDMNFEQQARSLGANAGQVFWHVTLPAVMPGIVVGALFTFLVSWSQYVMTLVIGGGRVITLPLLLFNFANAGRNDLTGALSIIYVLPGVLIMVLTARFLTGRNSALATMAHP